MNRKTENYQKDENVERFLEKFNLTLAQLEKECLPDSSVTVPGPLFICGAPRSGTTLITQILSRTGLFSYVDNFVARFWRAPYVGMRLEKILGLRENYDLGGHTYESDYGRTLGILDPHEFTYFWKRWLKVERSMSPHLADDVDAEGLRREVEAMAGVQNKPMFFKNEYFMGDPGVVGKIFPNAHFINMERETIANAASIYNARIKYNGDAGEWFSIRPSNYEILKGKPVEEQIIGQIKSIKASIDKFRKNHNGKIIDIKYEKMCQSPIKAVEIIARRMNLEMDFDSLRKRLPENFTVPEISGSKEIIARLDDALKNF